MCQVISLLFLICMISNIQANPQTYEIITPADSKVPACETKNQRTYLRFKKDNLCYEANTKGPCGQNMIFFEHPSSKRYGFCDCFSSRSETEEEKTFINSPSLTHCVPEIRSQIYVPERDRCYSAFDQGPCPDGKWLVLNSTFYPVCAKNTCATTNSIVPSNERKNPLSTKYWFALSSTSKCYQTMTRGYCPQSYELRFSGNHFIPQCRYISPEKAKCPPSPSSKPQIRRLQCTPGGRYDFLTKCSGSINPR